MKRSMNEWELPVAACDNGPVKGSPTVDHYAEAAVAFNAVGMDLRLAGHITDSMEMFDLEERCRKVLRLKRFQPGVVL